MDGMQWRIRKFAATLLTVLLVVSMVAGCTTTRPVALSSAGIATVQPGDLVRVVTRDGQAYRFGVVEVTPTALVGEKVKVDFADIERIDRREFSTPKTAGLVIVIVTFVGLVVYALSNMAFFPG